jgi:nondiscriminating aspartyl-tRNA synthetase
MSTQSRSTEQPSAVSALSSPRIHSIEVAAHIGERIHIAGWLHALRRLGGISFLILRDGWGIVQVVATSDDELAPLHTAQAGPESVLLIEGLVATASQAPGGIELHEPRVTVLTAVTETPPVTLGKRELKASLTTMLDEGALTNRHPTRRAVYRLGASAMASFRETLTQRDFTEIQTPKLVESATEGGANVFALDYFGRPAYLAQSPQFYKQVMVGVYERVFEVGPVFRAEPHDTTRHINEYVSLDMEMGFIENHFTIMAIARDVLAAMMERFRVANAADLALLGVDMPEVPAKIPHIHFADAQELILRLHGVDVRGEPDLSPQDERWLGEWARAEHGSDFLFVTGYPMRKRPFYTHPDLTRPEYSNSADLLFRGTELMTGGQRLHRYADYLAALAERGLSPEPFTDYLEAFRYGMPPHGGFAIGLERLLMQLIGLPSVKLATLFPRDLNRLRP